MWKVKRTFSDRVFMVQNIETFKHADKDGKIQFDLKTATELAEVLNNVTTRKDKKAQGKEPAK